MDGSGGGEGGREGGGDEGGGGATTSGTMAWPTDTGAADSTVSPRLEEISSAGRVARTSAAAVTAAAAAAALVVAVLSLSGGASGMVRTAATLTEPPETRSVRKHAGS